jgi:hypothetical protein
VFKIYFKILKYCYSDVTTSGFCSSFCGWHSYHGSYKFAWIGVPKSGCSCYAQSTSPNRNFGADAAVSVIAHELAESATDPVFTGWYYTTGSDYVENGDQCAWSFPGKIKLSTGAYYNIVVGGKNYLIQSNWNLATKTCRMS